MPSACAGIPDIAGQDDSFTLQVLLGGMAPDNCLRVGLPTQFLEASVSQLLDKVFPADDEGQRAIAQWFDLRENPDLPLIYVVYLAACEEWRDWRCALLVSSDGRDVELDTPVSSLLDTASDPPLLSLRLEQRYRALDYAGHHGFSGSRGELLDWMRSLTVLYFLDKHEVEIRVVTGEYAPLALTKALADLQSQGIIAPGTDEGDDEPQSQEIIGASSGESGDELDTAPRERPLYAITTEVGRRFIAGLLSETESYIDTFDHCQDALVDLDREVVEFGSGQGMDLRVQAYMAEGLDPIRTVFLLRLYDGTFDARLRDWNEVLENEDFFEAVLEPVVNRDEVSPDAIQLVIEHAYAWLEDQQEQARREASDQDLLRRAGGQAP